MKTALTVITAGIVAVIAMMQVGCQTPKLEKVLVKTPAWTILTNALIRGSEPKDGWATVPPGDIEKITKAIPEKAPATPKQPRKVLVFWLCEGFPHGCIPWCNKMLEIMAEKTGAFFGTLCKDKSVFTTENLKQYDGIILNNTTGLKFTPEQRQALLDFVNNGKGLIGIHAATDCFGDWPAGVALLGGQFDGHPWGAGGTWAFKLDDPAHPVNASFGGKGFKAKDEIYQIKGPYSRDTHRVLLSLDMSDERTGGVDKKGLKRKDNDFAVAWLKQTGRGRVFYCSLGHNNEIFWTPAIVAHYLAGIQYALGDLKVDDTPTAKK